MEKHDINTIYRILRNQGDDFWNNKGTEEESNVHLFLDILEYLDREGYDLKLIKKGS